MASYRVEYETVDQFSQRISDIVMAGFVSTGIALGTETGLFDVMTKFDKAMTSIEIAEAAGLKERYVREWLGAMAAANIINVDSTSEKFFLPKYRVPTLKMETPVGLAGIASLNTALSYHFYDVVECFKKGGPDGIPNENYEHFYKIQTKVSRGWMLNKLLTDCLLKISDLAKRLEAGMNVVDIGCGHAELITKMARKYPNCRFVGVDVCETAIIAAKHDPNGSDLENLNLLVCDAEELPRDWTEQFQLVMFHDSLHNMANPERVMDEVYRVMSGDGILSIFDTNCSSKVKGNVGIPGIMYPYICSLLYSVPASMTYGPKSAALGSMWGKERAIDLLRRTGFNLHSTREVQGGEQIHFVCTKRKELRRPPQRLPGVYGEEIDY